jgi:uncharacterized iron-regulated protein
MRWTWIASIALITACAATPKATIRPHIASMDKPIVDTTHHVRLSVDQAAQRWLQTRHIYVGEQHADPAYHRVQLEVLKRVAQKHPSVAIGIEWLPQDAQSTIDDWMRGALDDAVFREKVDWRRRWGFPFKAYEAIFQWAKAHQVPIIALNAPTGLARQLGRVGMCGLSTAEQAALTPLDTGNEDHRRYFRALMTRVQHHSAHHGSHGQILKNPCPNESNDKIARYYQAQLLRDEAMSRRAAEVLSNPNHSTRILLVFAGIGHVDYGLGIPKRVQTLTNLPFSIVLPIQPEQSPGHGVLDPAPGPRANFLWEIPDSTP